jgi:hypothetical protein
MQSILPHGAVLCCHQVQGYAAVQCNGMLPPSAITKGWATSHPRRRRVAAQPRFDQDVVGISRWRVRCGLPTTRTCTLRRTQQSLLSIQFAHISVAFDLASALRPGRSPALHAFPRSQLAHLRDEEKVAKVGGPSKAGNTALTRGAKINVYPATIGGYGDSRIRLVISFAASTLALLRSLLPSESR